MALSQLLDYDMWSLFDFPQLSFSPITFHLHNTISSDLIEKRNHYELSVSVPGFTEKEVNVEWHNGLLSINAHKERSSLNDQHWRETSSTGVDKNKSQTHMPYPCEAGVVYCS